MLLKKLDTQFVCSPDKHIIQHSHYYHHHYYYYYYYYYYYIISRQAMETRLALNSEIYLPTPRS